LLEISRQSSIESPGILEIQILTARWTLPFFLIGHLNQPSTQTNLWADRPSQFSHSAVKSACHLLFHGLEKCHSFTLI
jgi:hypothetical protein